jgi:hypothetical protein
MTMSQTEFKLGGAGNADMGATPASDAEWQRLWLAITRKPWTSLAVVPADSGIRTDDLAETLVAVGRQHGARRPVRVLSAVGARLGDVQQLIESVRQLTSRGDCVVIALDPFGENPAAIPIAGATSGVLLVVRIGTSRLSSARRVAEAIGPERLLGSVVLG